MTKIPTLHTTDDGPPGKSRGVDRITANGVGHPGYCQDQSHSVADLTWRQGFLHLTVDGDGLVSLWDHEMTDEVSYVRLQLTMEQVAVLEVVSQRGGSTP
mgnify:CR=1 FL=1